MIDAIARTIEAGGLVLTVTQRLARHLHREHASLMRRKGVRTWPTPDILPLDAWLHRSHQMLRDRRMFDAADEDSRWTLLSREQELLVWEDVIERVMKERLPVHIRHAAEAAANAYALLQRWRIPLDAREAAGREDTTVFLRARNLFEQRCAANHWRPSPAVLDQIIEALGLGVLEAPDVVAFVGFTIRRPEVTRLAEALRASGHAVDDIVFDSAPRDYETRVYSTVGDEILAAALWAKERLADSETNTVGIVAPDLGTHRTTLERVFGEVLEPDAAFSEPRDSVFEISLGVPLAQLPVTRNALFCLDMLRPVFSSDTAGAVLRSPYIRGAAAERFERAMLDALLRENAPADLTRDLILRRGVRFNRQDGTSRPLAPEFAALIDGLPAPQGFRSPIQWVELFERALRMLGWPGDRALNSGEFQAVQAWKAVLSAFEHFETVRPSMDMDEALSRIRRLATDRIFQERKEGARVQIVGLLEAAGLAFDHLWVMNLHLDAWPHTTTVVPLIPYPLQVRFDLPFATPASAHAISAALLGEVLANSRCAPVVSYPAKEGDKDLLPSPLLRPDSPAHPLPVDASGLYTSIIAREGRRDESGDGLIEHVFDTSGPALAGNEDIRGGSRILENQAACPFRAFAVSRLGSGALGEPERGLTASQKGTMVHDTLHAFWSGVETHENLERMSAEERSRRVIDAVDTAEPMQPADIRSSFGMEVERERVRRLVEAWLEHELQRGPFSTDAGSLEAPMQIRIGGLDLRTRVDRIDTLPDGRLVLIDYKTGEVDPNEWREERPENCQLLLYALGQERSVSALSFAQLKVGKLGYRGVGDGEVGIDGIRSLDEFYRKSPDGPSAWADQLDIWRDRLTTLAEEFRAGFAAVNPKRFPSTCTYCDQHALCRIAETTRSTSAGDAGNDHDEQR